MFPIKFRLRMNNWWLVFLGGGAGSVVRYGANVILQKMLRTPFPLSTLMVNIIASFVLGLMAAAMMKYPGRYENHRLLIGVGFCGGLSTFSSFSLELFDMMREGRVLLPLVYMLTSILACLAAIWIVWKVFS